MIMLKSTVWAYLTHNIWKVTLNFQYGLFNAPCPNPNFDKDFILDLDCTTKKVKVIDEVVDELKQMNKYIQSKFEESITDILREEMEDSNE